MAGTCRSPDAEDPNCGCGGADPSRTPQEPEDYYSAAASPLSARPSGQPPGTSVVADEGAALASAWGSDDEDKPTDRDKNPSAASFLMVLSSSPMGGSSSSSSFSSDSSDRTCGGASTSSCLDAYNYLDFYTDPPSEEMYKQNLGSSFWVDEYKACDDTRAYFLRDEYEASEKFSTTIHEKAPLSSLAPKLVSENMQAQIYTLLDNYSGYREICPDGNCFYRSFLFSYLEQLDVSRNEELRLFGVLEPMWDKFQSLRWSNSYSDLHIAFVSFILECVAQKQKLSVSAYQDWLFQESQNEQKFAKTLSYLRLVTATEICTKVEEYTPHIPVHGQKPDVVRYCRKHVIPMKEEAESINLYALTHVLQVPLQVVHIWDRPIVPNTIIIYESPDSSVPSVILLYRPGHYDIIYEK